MKTRILLILALLMGIGVSSLPVYAQSTRKERRLIMKGNDLYKERKFVEAESTYQQALETNPNSTEARYNLGLSQVRQVTNPADTTAKNKQILDKARENFTAVANMAKTKPGIAEKASYNLGNIEFNVKEYAKAIEHYKQALRIDPGDERARKNLRIAQKNLQQQNQDQNKQDQNKDQNKDQQDKQDQQNQQNQQNQQDQQKDKKEEQKQNDLSQQAATQMLQAIDNKENQTRARVNRANKGDKSVGNGRNVRKW